MKKFLPLIAVMLMIHGVSQSSDRQYLRIQSDTLGVIEMPRLVPMPSNPNARISLDGTWKFATVAPQPTEKIARGAYPDTIQVPGQWLQQGFKVEKNSSAGYAREFAIPAAWRSERVFIRFDAVFSECEVWVNGQRVGGHLGGFTPFDVDVTEALRSAGSNSLMLRVRSESVADSAASASRYAYHQMGGISRKVTLFAVPKSNYITYLNATTSFKGEGFDKATLNVEIANSAPATVKIELLGSGSQSVVTATKEYKSNAGDIETFSMDVPSPKLWDPEHPNLYTLRVTTSAVGSKKSEVNSRQIGFRRIEVRGAQIFVNGNPIKLRGANHHEVMPLRGRSMAPGQWEEDVKLLRDANVNYIRTSHYPPAPELVEACDQQGMFLEIEAPFCWAHQTEIADKYYKTVLEDQTFTMVNLFKSNPSVLMWSVGNESLKWAEYFSRTAAKLAVIDPTRPRIFSQWTPDADQGKLEVTNYHYPGPDVAAFASSKRPVTFDEYCHVNSYNRLEYITDPSVRDRWGIALRDMWEKMYATPAVLGGAIWGGIDDTFVLPDSTVVGYGTWGPLDGWRREKPEYWHVKKVYSPVKVTATGLTKDGVLSLGFENRFQFTNLSECNIKWQSAGQQGTLKLNAKQGGRTDATIPTPKGATELLLTITDPRGVEVDRYTFTVGSAPLVDVVPSEVKHSSVVQRGDNIVVSVDSITATIIRSSGAISISRGGAPVICSTPELMVLPLNAEGYGIQMTGERRDWSSYTPTCAGRIVERVSVERLASGEVQIHLREQYLEAVGQTTYTIGAAGRIGVEFDYTMLKSVNPRQWGLVFSLPSTFDRLEWHSRGIWNNYPDDHIGRSKGVAQSRNGNPDSGPAGPTAKPQSAWKDDQNRWGTNDFRSTKCNVIKASLVSTSLADLSLGVEGTTGLNTRCWIDSGSEGSASGSGNGTGQIKMLVAPYSNLGSEGFLRSHAAAHDTPLRAGDRLKGNFTLMVGSDL